MRFFQKLIDYECPVQTMPSLHTRTSLPAVSVSCRSCCQYTVFVYCVSECVTTLLISRFLISQWLRGWTEKATNVGLLCIGVAQITVIGRDPSVSFSWYLNARGEQNWPWCSSWGGRTLSVPRSTSADICVPYSSLPSLPWLSYSVLILLPYMIACIVWTEHRVIWPDGLWIMFLWTFVVSLLVVAIV